MVVVLAANGGGHIVELSSLVSTLITPEERLWFVPRSSQSKDIVGSDRVVWSESAPSRDLIGALRNLRLMQALLRRDEVSAVLSTGSSLAVSSLIPAALAGKPAVFVESAARVHGPSLSGRMLRPFSGIQRFSQHFEFARGGWTFAGSVFDSYEPSKGSHANGPFKILVTLGTTKRYNFDRLIAQVAFVVHSQDEVLIQGEVARAPWPGAHVVPVMSHTEFRAAVHAADVVISHAGVGSALAALDAGKLPILVPRRLSHREHVDDHQVEIANFLARKGLAITASADELSIDHVRSAASGGVQARGSGSRMVATVAEALRRPPRPTGVGQAPSNA